MTTLQVFKLSPSHALVLEPDDVEKLTFYAIYLFLTKVSRQTQDHNQLLRLVALKGATYSINMGRVKRHSYGCKSRDQVELTLKEFKTPLFSSDERKQTRVLRGYCGVIGPNHTIGFWTLAESMRSPNPRRNISSDKLNADRV